VSFPNEGAKYREARNALLNAEIALRQQVETVAAMRRGLPLGGEAPQDYVFQEGDPARDTRLSALFGGKQTLVVYSFMYGPEMAAACPNCTSILDALDGEAKHIVQRVSLAVVARSPIARIRKFAEERAWRDLRLLSSANNTYNVDYHGENAQGEQTSNLNVFTLKDGTVRHAYSTEMQFVPRVQGGDPRHVDSIWPMWSLFDFTPDGRGDGHPKLHYASAAPT
jgi:predicted dithiol-disulfide oxidoreductase (DUF899 family)